MARLSPAASADRRRTIKLAARLLALTAVPGILVLAAVFIIRVDAPWF